TVETMDEVRLLALLARALLPLVEAVGRNDAAALLERPLERAARGDGLGAGVDHLQAGLDLLGPHGHEAPVEGLEAPFTLGRLDDGVDVVRGGVFVAGCQERL